MNTRYDDTAALAKVAPRGAVMDQQGESETEWAIRLRQRIVVQAMERNRRAPADLHLQAEGRQTNPGVPQPHLLMWPAVYAERIAAAKAAGARQERRASQKVMCWMIPLSLAAGFGFGLWIAWLIWGRG